jgi:beta-lactamase regulating signal transducer with metallopeptidase domain
MMEDLALRGAIILAVAWGLTAVLGRKPAATRHFIWVIALALVLFAPAIRVVAPSWPVPQRIAERVTVSGSAIGSWATGERLTGEPVAPARTAIHRGAAPAIAHRSTVRSALARVSRTLWLGGSAIVLVWFAAAWLHAAAIVRRSRQAPGTWQVELNALCERLQILDEVRLRIVDAPISPLVVSLWRSTVLLPAAAIGWSDDRRRVVCLHELAHVRRGDCRTQVLAQLVCTVHWFNPLAWLALTRLRSERERACDDEVLKVGLAPSAYATHLLDIARELRPNWGSHAALAMARPSELEGRLVAILAARTARVPARRIHLAFAALMTMVTAVVLGAANPASEPSRTGRFAERALYLPPDAAVPQPSSARRSLEDGLNDADRGVREEAALELALMPGTDVVPALIKALSDSDAQVREKAALGLALRTDPRATDALLAAVEDSDAQVREKAAMALSTSTDTRAVAALQRAATDPDSQVRDKALAGLSRVGGVTRAKEELEGVRENLRGLIQTIGRGTR